MGSEHETKQLCCQCIALLRRLGGRYSSLSTLAAKGGVLGSVDACFVGLLQLQ